MNSQSLIPIIKIEKFPVTGNNLAFANKPPFLYPLLVYVNYDDVIVDQ